MHAFRPILLIASVLLLTSCGSETITASDRPAFDGGGYLGTGGRASDPPPATGDTTQVSGFGGGYLGTGG